MNVVIVSCRVALGLPVSPIKYVVQFWDNEGVYLIGVNGQLPSGIIQILLQISKAMLLSQFCMLS